MKGTVLSETTDTVSVLTYGSTNRKTGDMDQTWHMCKHFHPVAAKQYGMDRAVCFDCKLSGGRGCYVDVGKAVAGVWLAWRRGVYSDPMAYRRPIRFGAYGDPTLVPVEIIRDIKQLTPISVGYTHRWREAPTYKGLFMASVDSLEEQVEAEELGWRTFRTVRSYDDKLPHEAVCCHDASGVRCWACGLCAGDQTHVVLKAHGPLKHRLPCYTDLQLKLDL